MKFYDLTFCLLICFAFGANLSNSYAGGNDPSDRNKSKFIERSGGGGNDPTGKSIAQLLKGDRSIGGGGHDPDDHRNSTCTLTIDNKKIIVQNPKLCKMKSFFEVINTCEKSSDNNCDELNDQLDNFKSIVPVTRE